MLGIHHAGIVVSDLHRAIDFYTGVLGLELMAEPSGPSSGPHLERVLNLPGARIHAGALLRAGAGAVELHEFEAPEWTGPGPVPAHALGAQHVAFWCQDIAAEKAAVESRGGTFLAGINHVDSGPFAGLRTAFLLDPDGIRIEFVEVAYWPEDERRAGAQRYLNRRRAMTELNQQAAALETAWCAAIDTGDLPAVQAMFAEGGTFFARGRSMDAAERADFFTALWAGGDRGTHVTRDVTAVPDGDRVAVTAPLTATFIHPDGSVRVVRGHYDDVAVSTPGGLRLVSKKITIERSEELPA